jgi:cytochrome c5
MRLSQALIDTATVAARAAEAKDADQLFNAGADVYSVCSNCHAKYLMAIVAAEAK